MKRRCKTGKHQWSVALEVASYCHKCFKSKDWLDYKVEEICKTRSGRWMWRTRYIRRNWYWFKDMIQEKLR